MLLGMSLFAFTIFHTALSLIGIAAGFVVAAQLLRSRQSGGWTAVFLWATILTCVTGFMFPVDKVLPSHVVGVLSLVLLALALFGLYRARLAGNWRWIYAGTAVAALYLNTFVLVVQAFLKIPALAAIAPTQSHPVFVGAQSVVLVAFVIVGIFAMRGFRPRTDFIGMRAA